LACDHIILTDDGSSTVSLPELPLLAVLPGTGGLTRVTDKRKVRRDHADVFCTTEEGIKGKRAVDWRLVDEVVPNTKLRRDVAPAPRSSRRARTGRAPPGIALTPLERAHSATAGRALPHVEVESTAPAARHVTLRGPDAAAARRRRRSTCRGRARSSGRCGWRASWTTPSCICAERADVGVDRVQVGGRPGGVLAYDALPARQPRTNWLAREILLYWKRVLKRVDVTSRSLVALVEPGSCFAGTLAELLFAADRSYMLTARFEGDNRPPRAIRCREAISAAIRWRTASPGCRRASSASQSGSSSAARAHRRDARRRGGERLGLVTFAYDDIDWEDEIRIFLEERASFSPDALTGMEANLRFAGPETMETKIFGRLTAWQNWIFQRPNAVGEDGALAALRHRPAPANSTCERV
jgi:benzoyl-CoA-dihydrodiol lyase